jgi:hypothetical protein
VALPSQAAQDESYRCAEGGGKRDYGYEVDDALDQRVVH